MISLRADALVVFMPQLHIKALIHLKKQDGTLKLPDAFLGVMRAKEMKGVEEEAEPRCSLVVEGRSLRVTDAVDNATLASFELLQRVRSLPHDQPSLQTSRSLCLESPTQDAPPSPVTARCVSEHRAVSELRTRGLGKKRKGTHLNGSQKHPYAIVDGTR